MRRSAGATGSPGPALQRPSRLPGLGGEHDPVPVRVDEANGTGTRPVRVRRDGGLEAGCVDAGGSARDLIGRAEVEDQLVFGRR